MSGELRNAEMGNGKREASNGKCRMGNGERGTMNGEPVLTVFSIRNTNVKD